MCCHHFMPQPLTSLPSCKKRILSQGLLVTGHVTYSQSDTLWLPKWKQLICQILLREGKQLLVSVSVPVRLKNLVTGCIFTDGWGMGACYITTSCKGQNTSVGFWQEAISSILSYKSILEIIIGPCKLLKNLHRPKWAFTACNTCQDTMTQHKDTTLKKPQKRLNLFNLIIYLTIPTNCPTVSSIAITLRTNEANLLIMAHILHHCLKEQLSYILAYICVLVCIV